MLKTFSGDATQTGLAGFEKKLTGNEPDDSVIPKTVRRAVRFMLSGAAITFIVGVFLIVATIVDKNALTDSNGKKITNGQFTSGIVSTVLIYVVLVVLWVLMARFNRSGYAWARVVASLFCAISTFDAYSLANSLTGTITITVVGIVYVVGTLLIWAVGVLAIAMLWRGESSAYFRARSAARQ